MSYREEEQARLRRQGSKQAIALAMESRWGEAVAANKNLIESFPTDVDAYNRLGKAYMELGEYSQSREAYSRAIELDPYNDIAKKNLHRLSHLEGVPVSPKKPVVGVGIGSDKVQPQHFIEETGKSGVVSLSQPASPEVLARMIAGDRVYLKTDDSTLIVENGRGEYLGQVKSRQGQRLANLMKGGNIYSAAIVSSVEDAMTIIIREVYQHPSQAGRLSFPSRGIEELRPYVGDRIIRRELEYEEALSSESGYTILGGDEIELLPEESADLDEESDIEE